MGVIYKLKPEIKEFILEKKKTEPALSCRKLSDLITEKFQFKLSKSSINAIIKEAGLSMPVGRHPKKRRRQAIIVVPVITPVAAPIAIISAQKALCFKLEVGGKFIAYCDAQFHTLWPSAGKIPPDFSASLLEVSNYMENCFKIGSNFVFFMAPGYDTPTEEFLNLVEAFGSEEEKELHLTYYNGKLEEISRLQFKIKKQFFLCGIWPWQFRQSQPVALRTCDLGQNIKLKLLTNARQEDAEEEQLAALYLNRWPKPPEVMAEFSRKIESAFRKQLK